MECSFSHAVISMSIGIGAINRSLSTKLNTNIIDHFVPKQLINYHPFSVLDKLQCPTH